MDRMVKLLIVFVARRVVARSLPLLAYLALYFLLPHKNIAPRRPVLALPARALLPLLVPHDAKSASVVIARVRVCLKSEAALELEAGVAAEVADVPEGVGLALEEGDDDRAAASKGGRGRGEGALEEGDEQLLVVADLAVDVCGLAADVGEVEDDSVVGDAGDGGRELGSVDVVDKLVVDDLALLGIDSVGIVVVLVVFIVFIVVVIAVRLTVCIGIGSGAVTGGIRAAVDDGNVGIHGGVLC